MMILLVSGAYYIITSECLPLTSCFPPPRVTIFPIRAMMSVTPTCSRLGSCPSTSAAYPSAEKASTLSPTGPTPCTFDAVLTLKPMSLPGGLKHGIALWWLDANVPPTPKSSCP